MNGRKERRNQTPPFTTLGSLYSHYEKQLPREIMIAAVREAISGFVSREGAGADETRLQLVRKCETCLRRQTLELPGDPQSAEAT